MAVGCLVVLPSAIQVPLCGRLAVVVGVGSLVQIVVVIHVITVVSVSNHLHSLLHLCEVFNAHLVGVILALIETKIDARHLIPISLGVLLANVHISPCLPLLIDLFSPSHILLECFNPALLHDCDGSILGEQVFMG